MRIKITEQQLKTLRENVNSIEIEDNKLENVIMEAVRSVLTEGQILVDNFDMVYKLLEFNPNGDDFYFVQIIKRYKDNPNDDKRQGNYRNGAWYLNSWRIHSVDELKQLRPQIINICNQNNARAYITINPRSTQETDNYINYLKRKLGPNAQNIEDRGLGFSMMAIQKLEGIRLRLKTSLRCVDLLRLENIRPLVVEFIFSCLTKMHLICNMLMLYIESSMIGKIWAVLQHFMLIMMVKSSFILTYKQKVIKYG